MQALKILVVVMGVLIVAGIAVIGVTIYNRLAGGGEGRPVAAADGADGRRGFGTVDLSLPEGCEIVDVIAEGERLIVWSGARAGCERVYVYDVSDGTLLGTLDITIGP